MKRSSAYLAMLMVSGLALPFATVGSAHAERGQPQLQRSTNQNMQMQKVPNAIMYYSLKCSASGSPVEFPNDVLIVNQGNATIAAGKKVEWKMSQGNFAGVHTLSASLEPLKGTHLMNAIPGGITAGTPCTAKVIQ